MRVEVGWWVGQGGPLVRRPVDRILQSLGQIPHELTLITDRISSQEFQSSLQKQRETVSKRLLLAEKGLSLLKGNESDHPGHLGGGLVVVQCLC